ncbi:S-locus glycoprotein domain [Dillenia turbinata]|uniref:Receptor-like serine/threonine-protein kinase n=1 Tax=Dillenia turbinata TaxID=194707 RepID=A0AAN8VFC2_9MAGN
MRDKIREDKFSLTSISLFYIFISFQYCAAIDVIAQTQNLLEGETLVSPSEIFELGFFRPNGSTNQYIGIWHKNIRVRKIIWVANRENPIAVSHFSASLSIGEDGNLKILDGKQTIIWSTHVDIGINKTVALLLDNGNFVLKYNDSGVLLWESFHFPGNTLIADILLSVNSKTGEGKFLTSWKSEDDPSIGDFTNGLAPSMPTQCYLWKSLKPYWRSGVWNGVNFIGVDGAIPSYFGKCSVTYTNENAAMSLYGDNNIILVLEANGSLRKLRWDENSMEWIVLFEIIPSSCQVYGTCGAFGICDPKRSPICNCLEGFEPESREQWSRGNYSGGCVRRVRLNCVANSSSGSSLAKHKKDGFWKVGGVKLPDFPLVLDLEDEKQCQDWCLNNCSCWAYTYAYELRCMFWTTDLVDIQKFTVSGMDLFLRLAHSELDVAEDKKKTPVILIVCIISEFITVGCLVYGFFRWKKKNQRVARKEIRKALELEDSGVEGRGNGVWHPTPFEFNTIVLATDNFSVTNKLGQGGFGIVYKGKLIDGQEVAVKRLSNTSGQGREEFMNEIILISKLQHRNLVKLLGYCIEGDEKLLIYEHMPNKSLDTFLFAEGKWSFGSLWSSFVPWRPLAYLFLLAKVMLSCILGYMSPEYAMGGIFSEKTDVFSFGVLLLEIVSGKKNTSPRFYEQSLNLVGYAWHLWNEGRILELMDQELVHSFCKSEVLRCIHVGLLCVQNYSKDRPKMSVVVLMLSSETDRPQPKEPAFAFEKPLEHDQHAVTSRLSSQNNSTWSDLEAR